MTSGMIDSVPVFLARTQSAGLSEDARARLHAGGLDTLAKLAFLAPVSPSSGDDSALITALKTVMAYDDASDPMPPLVQAVLRRKRVTQEQVLYDTNTRVKSEQPVYHRLSKSWGGNVSKNNCA